MILVEAAPAVLPPMGPKLGLKAQRRLEKMGVEVKLNTMVTDVDYMGLTVKEKDGETNTASSAQSRCGRPACRPARSASWSPSSPTARRSTGPAASSSSRTSPSRAIPTCSSSAT